jgi:hypothetical protein
MKKILVLALVFWGVADTVVFADTCATNLMPAFTASQAQTICTKFGDSVAESLIPQTDNAIDLGSASKEFRSAYIGTSLVFASGANSQLAAYVPTLAATPVAGTNQYLPGLNIIPTNAANNAGFLGAATPVVGQQFRIVNASGAAQRIKASGGATLNGATAGGYISIASLATVDCITAASGNQVCLQPVIPTPAGP